MAKKRTRRQKETAKHQFSVQWKPSSGKKNHKSEAKKDVFEADVKRQFKSEAEEGKFIPAKNKSTVDSDQKDNLKQIKKDITRSLIIAAIIIAAEMMLYLALKN